MSIDIKKKMRESLLLEFSVEERQFPYMKTDKGTLNADQVMEEVEQNTEVGVRVLNDFTVYYETGRWPLSDPELEQIAEFMEQDLNDKRPAEFGHVSMVVSDRGDERTPRQLVQEVRDRTVLGMEFAQVWAENNLTRLDPDEIN